MSAPVIVNPSGQPARVALTVCPKCGGQNRRPSSGIGIPHELCRACGFNFTEAEA